MGCCFACFRNHFKEYYQKKNTEKKKKEREYYQTLETCAQSMKPIKTLVSCCFSCRF